MAKGSEGNMSVIEKGLERVQKRKLATIERNLILKERL